MNRRQFLRVTGLTAGALCLAGPDRLCAATESAARPQAFSFVLLGDQHFARPAHYEPHGGDDYANRVCRLTDEAWDALWNEVAVVGKDGEPRPSFVLQVGDYVHGDCRSAEKTLEQYADFVNSMKRHALPVPLFLTRGNHELQGRGAREAYETHMPAFLRGVAPLTRGTAYYSFDVGPAAHFAVLDVYSRGGRGGSVDAEQLAWLEADLASYRQRSPGGLLAIVAHAPLFPMTPRGAVFDADPAAHADLLAGLVQHRADAVLCGHLHTVSSLTYTDPESGHRITQFMAYSMPGRDEVKAHNFRKPAYEAGMIERVDYRKPEEAEAMRRIVGRLASNVSGYRAAQIPGYQVVTVGDDAGGDVRIDSYRGLGRRLFDTLVLTPSR